MILKVVKVVDTKSCQRVDVALLNEYIYRLDSISVLSICIQTFSGLASFSYIRQNIYHNVTSSGRPGEALMMT